MKNVKILICSGIAATAMFMSLGLSASAETQLINESFDSAETTASYWIEPVHGNNMAAPVIDETYTTTGSTSGPRHSIVTFDQSTGDAAFVKLRFDFQASNYMNNWDHLHAINIKDSNDAIVFTLEFLNHRSRAKTAMLNGIALSNVSLPKRAASAWYTIEAVINTLNDTFDYTICLQNTETPIESGIGISTIDDISNISKLDMQLNQSANNNICLDNFYLATLIEPTITAQNSITLKVGETVSAASFTNQSLAFMQFNASLLDVTYSSGNTMITGLAPGTSTLSIEADSSDGTIAKKNISVTVNPAITMDAAANTDTTIVDINELACGDNVSGYSVRTVAADGTTVNTYTVEKSAVQKRVLNDATIITAERNTDGTLEHATISNANANSILPIVEGADVYAWDSLGSMTPVETERVLSVDTTDAATVEVSPIFVDNREYLTGE